MFGTYLPSPAITTPFPDGLVEPLEAAPHPTTKPMTGIAAGKDRANPLRRLLRHRVDRRRPQSC